LNPTLPRDNIAGIKKKNQRRHGWNHR
jgi:hypothetical protein